ncbi:MAG: hypothetical protein AAFO07_22070 [Bacteroidota bacterium]
MNLNYLYIRNSIIVEHFFNDKWSGLFNVQVNQRTSKLEVEEELTFGIYQNTYLGLGTKLRF